MNKCTNGCGENTLHAGTICHKCAAGQLTEKTAPTSGMSNMEQLMREYNDRMYKSLGENGG